METNQLDFFEKFINDSTTYYNTTQGKLIYQEIYKYFGNNLTLSFLMKTISYPLLSHYLVSSTSRKYLSKNDALRDNNKNKESILIYVEELEIYLVFDDIVSYNFMRSRMDFESNKGITFIPYQIVPTNIKQKIVFSLRGNEEENLKLKQLSREFFRSEIYSFKKNNEEEITIIVDLVSNYYEVFNIVKELCNKVFQQNGNIAKNILPLHEHIVDSISYTMSIIYYDSDLSKGYMMEDIFRHTKFIKKIEDNNKIIETSNNNIFDKNEIMNNWIKNNPPQDKEGKVKYYTKFCNETKRNFKQNLFNKCVTDNYNITEIRIKGLRCWTYVN